MICMKVVFYFSRFARSDGIVKVHKIPKIFALVIDADLRPPFLIAVKPNYACYAGRIGIPLLLVSHIDPLGHGSKVANAIVGGVSVYVIDNLFGPVTMMQRIANAVSIVFYVVDMAVQRPLIGKSR
jgi:hypothetical protein